MDRHPLIEGLLLRLPEPDSAWRLAARRQWLQAAADIFDILYGDGAEDNVEPSRLEILHVTDPQRQRGFWQKWMES